MNSFALQHDGVGRVRRGDCPVRHRCGRPGTVGGVSRGGSVNFSRQRWGAVSAG